MKSILDSESRKYDDNEVRPVFRVLAAILALPAWFASIVFGVLRVADDYSVGGLMGALSGLFLALLFTYAAVKGRVPRWVTSFF